MSGGSLDYSYRQVLFISEMVRQSAQRPAHKALATHLEKVAEALRKLEWVLSGDAKAYS